MSHTYLAVVCDDQGIEKPNGKVHWATTESDGSVVPKETCPSIRSSWFFELTYDLHSRARCKRCGKMGPGLAEEVAR